MANRTIVIPAAWGEGALELPITPVTGVAYRDSAITASEVKAGWAFGTTADSSKLNELLLRISSLLMLSEQYGVLPFCATTTYALGGLAMGSNGVVYESIVASNYGHDPVTDTGHSYWDVLARDKTPVGTVIHIAKNTAPAGYLKANGAAVSRTTYSALFAVIGTTFGAGDGSTTFNLPDLRGEFLRGWDDSRGIDTGRIFGSAQSDDFKAHSHPFTDSTVSETSRQYAKLFASGSIDNAGPVRVNISSTTNNAGGTETRPRNIALLACIKY